LQLLDGLPLDSCGMWTRTSITSSTLPSSSSINRFSWKYL
jgi:hypothetical protein